jgi:opacity protein-like surface antigen
MTLRRLATAAIAAIAMTAVATASASAWVSSDRTQTQHNYAGVVFHANGDCFDIYDNVANGKRVRVSWNYAGVDDKVKFLYSDGHHTLRCLKIKEPAEIYFKVKGHDQSGFILYDSPIARWRPYG